MKKALLFLGGLALYLTPDIGAAQSYTFQNGSKDTIGAYYSGSNDLNVNNYIKATNGTMAVKWRVTSVALGTNWGFTGLCDNVTCYNATQSQAGRQSDPYSTSYGDFHVVYTGLLAAPHNTYSIVRATVTDTTGGSPRTITFIGYKSPQGVPGVITSDDEVTIFPNPARDAVNVIFDENAGVKTIAIYNLIGKMMNVYKPTDVRSAKLDIDNIPAGVYFLRLMDGQGHVLATRRFTRQ